VRGSSHKGDRTLGGLVSAPQRTRVCPATIHRFHLSFRLWGAPHQFCLVLPCFPRGGLGPALGHENDLRPTPNTPTRGSVALALAAARPQVGGSFGGGAAARPAPGSGLSREASGAAQRGAGATGGIFSDGNRFPERTMPNKNTRFGPKNTR
jgi:hypothetical protein